MRFGGNVHQNPNSTSLPQSTTTHSSANEQFTSHQYRRAANRARALFPTRAGDFRHRRDSRDRGRRSVSCRRNPFRFVSQRTGGVVCCGGLWVSYWAARRVLGCRGAGGVACYGWSMFTFFRFALQLFSIEGRSVWLMCASRLGTQL